jgi:glycosyltransferase involved in cell wall biosynthesis
MKTLITIPSYNDSEHLPDLIQGIRQTIDLPILVIDDGSDIPVDINNSYIEVIRNELNLGKGGALKNGFRYASQNGFSHVITIDADLQHDPHKLIEFIEFDKDCIIVCGQRSIDSSMPLHRQISNKLTSRILSALCGQKIYDSQCGYRRYSVKAVLGAQCIENGFQFESEVLIKLAKMGNGSIGHLKIPTIYGNEKSSIRNIKDTLKFIILIIRNIW